MNGKKLVGMGIALVLLVAIAALQHRGAKRSAPAVARKTLLQGIDLNAVTAIEVAKGTNSVGLAKKDGLWRVESLYGYPVNFERLANAVRAMADAKLGAPVRAGNVDPSEFGLGTNETKIVLKSGGSPVATVEVGARRAPSSEAGWARQHFVRRDGKGDIYLVDYDFRAFSERPEEWIKTQILNVPSDDIVSVKSGDVDLKLDGGKWVLADLDPAKEEFQPSEASKLRSALRYLHCETIADGSKGDAQLGFTNAVEYVAKTRDGFTYTARFGGETKEGWRYARFSVDYKKPAPPSAPGKDAKQEEKEAYKKQLDAFNKTCEANAEKAKKLNKQLGGWTYVLSDYEVKDFTIPRSQLVKPKEKPDEKKSDAKADGGKEKKQHNK